jgi:hypothetical protein
MRSAVERWYLNPESVVELLHGVVVVVGAYQDLRLSHRGISQGLPREPLLHVPDLVAVCEAD